MTPQAIIAATMLVVAGLTVSGCTADESPGVLEVRAWGEDYIEAGIPAEVFSDGWTIEWTRFAVTIVTVETADEEDEQAYVVDLTTPSMGRGQPVTSLSAPAGSTELAYTIGPAMASSGDSLVLEGVATKDEQSVSFAWAFQTRTRYEACEIAEEVPAGGTATSVITIHSDHLFYDDLESPEPNVAFDLVASGDADGDGMVTEDELRLVDITGEERYQVGSAEIDDLWGFLAAQTQSLGHIDGEGHCESAPE